MLAWNHHLPFTTSGLEKKQGGQLRNWPSLINIETVIPVHEASIWYIISCLLPDSVYTKYRWQKIHFLSHYSFVWEYSLSCYFVRWYFQSISLEAFAGYEAKFILARLQLLPNISTLPTGLFSRFTKATLIAITHTKVTNLSMLLGKFLCVIFLNYPRGGKYKREEKLAFSHP